MTRELAALVASSNHLLNLQMKLTKSHHQVSPGLPGLNAVQMRVDDRFSGGVLTRGKKSTLPPEAFDRFASEVYPMAAAAPDFVLGTNTRWIGREPVVRYS
jgi:hypothetical protein